MGLEFFVPKNPALPCASSGGFLTTSQNLDKTNVPIPRKCPDGQKYGNMDRRTDVNS